MQEGTENYDKVYKFEYGKYDKDNMIIKKYNKTITY